MESRGKQFSPETIESFEAHTKIVAKVIDQPPTKVTAVWPHAFVFVSPGLFLVATRTSCSIRMVDQQAGHLVCNRAPVEMCTVLGSAMPSSGHLCPKCQKKSHSCLCDRLS